MKLNTLVFTTLFAFASADWNLRGLLSSTKAASSPADARIVIQGMTGEMSAHEIDAMAEAFELSYNEAYKPAGLSTNGIHLGITAKEPESTTNLGRYQAQWSYIWNWDGSRFDPLDWWRIPGFPLVSTFKVYLVSLICCITSLTLDLLVSHRTGTAVCAPLMMTPWVTKTPRPAPSWSPPR